MFPADPRSPIARASQLLGQGRLAEAEREASAALAAFGCIRVVAIEDLITALAEDSSHMDVRRSGIEEVSRKYLVPVN